MVNEHDNDLGNLDELGLDDSMDLDDLGFSLGDGDDLPDVEVDASGMVDFSDLDFSEELGDVDFGDLGDLGTDLLFSEFSVSGVCMKYLNCLKKITDRITPPKQTTVDDLVVSSSEFPYLDPRLLEPLKRAIYNRAVAQLSKKKSERSTPEENAEEIFDDVNSTLPFHVGANYTHFINACGRKCDHFMKLLSVSSAHQDTTISKLIDMDKLEQAQLAFEINGLLWNQVTRYMNMSDLDLGVMINPTPSGTMLSKMGVAMETYNEYRRTNNMPVITLDKLTVGDLKSCIEYVLGVENIADALHLSAGDIDDINRMGKGTDASYAHRYGEYLRRYALLEHDEGYFSTSSLMLNGPFFSNATASDFEKINFNRFPEDAAKTAYGAVIMFLGEPFSPTPEELKKGRINYNAKAESFSVVQELLYYIMVMVARGTPSSNGYSETLAEYIGLLIPYILALHFDTPYARPAVYYALSCTSEEENKFDLHYIVNGQNYCLHNSSFLVSVIGDNKSAYVVPEVMFIDQFTRDVECTSDANIGASSRPSCVLLPMLSLVEGSEESVTGNTTRYLQGMKIAGTTVFTYAPSLAWVSSHTYSSQSDLSTAQETASTPTRTSSALLQTLLSYRNDFSDEGSGIDACFADTEDGHTAIFLNDARDTRRKPVLISVSKNGEHVSDTGVLSIDPDTGELLLRYRDDTTPNNEGEWVTALADHGTYKVSKAFGDAVVDSNTLPPVSHFIELGTKAPAYRWERAELRSITKKICALNSIVYEEELAAVREIITRDLKYVIPSHHLDAILAGKCIEDYSTRLESKDMSDLANFNSLRALSIIVLGEGSVLYNKQQWDDECAKVFAQVSEAANTRVSALVELLDSFNPNIIALEVLSNSITNNVPDMKQYMALHAIPDINIRLRNLEERMLLLKILAEIDKEIAQVLRKSGPMFSVYLKVTTVDTFKNVASRFAVNMPGTTLQDPLPLTDAVLHADMKGSTAILKYFALERNMHGIMATLHGSTDPVEKELYDSISNDLGLNAAGMPPITQMDEDAFNHAPFAVSLEEVCATHHDQLLHVIREGLLSSTSGRIDIQIIKAYDLFVNYGARLFGWIAPQTPVVNVNQLEEYSDVSEYLDDFYYYVGSFLLSYCFLTGEALEQATSEFDRLLIYQRYAEDFLCSTDLRKFAKYDLEDFRTVYSVSSDGSGKGSANSGDDESNGV